MPLNVGLAERRGGNGLRIWVADKVRITENNHNNHCVINSNLSNSYAKSLLVIDIILESDWTSVHSREHAIRKMPSRLNMGTMRTSELRVGLQAIGLSIRLQHEKDVNCRLGDRQHPLAR